ncbi:helix-turn-helix transcriptional regulator [Thiolinea disciformis]|uniref:helix-turn-helix transcriptional regulator n=1 Tax=Thiolinea disciformis TaxID=125614 RepID=UPI00037CC3D9|nr:YafY family protein [Thiolinea disciformis]
MRRADRLFQLVQILRNKRLVTARELAERLEVSERTIYRDMQDLSLSGVPLEGEAGVGYRLRYSLDIPPLMFSSAEIEALVVGARMLRAWGGTELGQSAQSVLDKVYAVIPEELRHQLLTSHLFVPRSGERTDLSQTLDIVRGAISQHRYIELYYERRDGELSQRKVKPLGLFFWGQVWTLASWCELRNGFRSFRLDRILKIQVETDVFTEVAGQTLEDYFATRPQCD